MFLEAQENLQISYEYCFAFIGDGDYRGRDQEVQHRVQIRTMAFTRKHDQRKPMWRAELALIVSLTHNRVALTPF